MYLILRNKIRTFNHLRVPLLASFLIIVAPLHAQDSTPYLRGQDPTGTPVLHEFIEDTAETTAVQSAPHRNTNSPPPLAIEPQNGEPIFDPSGPHYDEKVDHPYGKPSPFGTKNQMDNATERVDQLNYFSNFTPSIIPYKRSVAQNKIEKNGGKYEFSVQSSPYEKIEIHETQPPESDIFWGSFLVQSESNQLHPIPSISPNQVILEIKSEPPSRIHIYKDGADNFAIKTDQNTRIRINIKLAVPTQYFQGKFPRIRWAMLSSKKRIPLATNIKKVAARVQKKINVSRKDSPRDALLKLIAYFRNFEGKSFPERLRKGDLYELIALHQVGVCRHRAQAFVITSNALGIPSRYVYNEAHAFVEIYWPQIGWRRVDLGGAANELNAAIQDGRGTYKNAEDTLPQPPRFIDEINRMRAQNNEDSTDTSDNLETNSEKTMNSDNSPSAPFKEDSTSTASEHISNPPVEDLRQTPNLHVFSARKNVKRGASIRITAELRFRGKAIKNEAIHAFIGPAGEKDPLYATEIGTAITNTKGRISAEFQIPPTQTIGRWEIFLIFEGSESYAATISD